MPIMRRMRNPQGKWELQLRKTTNIQLPTLLQEEKPGTTESSYPAQTVVGTDIHPRCQRLCLTTA